MELKFWKFYIGKIDSFIADYFVWNEWNQV